MKPTSTLVAALAAILAAFAALAPVRHRVVVEADPANPVRQVRVESRSLLGLKRPGWGVALSGAPAWGSAAAGFYLTADRPVVVVVSAWPRFRQSLSMAPTPAALVATLGEEGDREAFRTWFVALLEQQLEGPSPAWEPAQRDCAGLLRFAFREALASHTADWRERVAFAAGPPGQDPSPRFAPDWRRGFPTPEGPRPFAKGAYLRRLSCVPLGRELQLARPGDLIFFARGGAHAQPDHAMAFVRPDADGAPMLLYHTGPEGAGNLRQPGEVRRVRLDDLLHHPDPDFRPLPENPAFLGLYRWQPLVGGAPDAIRVPIKTPTGSREGRRASEARNARRRVAGTTRDERDTASRRPPALARREKARWAPCGVTALERCPASPCGPFLAVHPTWLSRGLVGVLIGTLNPRS